MLTPAEIEKKARRLWSRGAVVAAEIRGESLFPLRIAWGRPTARELRDNFGQVRTRIARLQAWCGRRQGCTIEWRAINHRSLGSQQIPAAVLLDREGFLGCVGKEKEYEQFRADLALVRGRRPDLEPWLADHARDLVVYGGSWRKLLAVVDFFSARPRPGLYLRQLDIEGVDTKFIEQHKKILASLLDAVLPADAVDQKVTGLAAHGFERRFGLRYDEPLVRLRFLDADAAPHPACTDLTLPLSGFARLQPEIDTVVITENKINGLSFPDLQRAVVVFGLGYGISALAGTDWLRDKRILYWGDIDTHGFSILSLVRSFLPQTISFLMDRDTLEAHRELWGQEEESKRCLDRLSRLTEKEEALYNDLKKNKLGERIRLEQERIGFSHVANSPLFRD
jgi:hypothetical protein